MRKLVASWIADYGTWAEGHRILAGAVAFDGSPALLLTPVAQGPRALPEKERYDGLSGSRPHRLVHLAPDGPHVIELPASDACYGFLAPLPGDRWLVLARYGDAPPLVVSAAGVAPLPLEDVGYLTSVATTEDGTIWTGFSDQSPIKALRFGGDDLVGLDVETFEGIGDAGHLCDVYALTPAADGTVFAYVYSGFTLYAWGPDRVVAAWSFAPAFGSAVFAVGRRQALFGPGYAQDGRLALVDLRGRPRGWRRVLTSQGGYDCHQGRLLVRRCRVVDNADRPLRFALEAARGSVLLLFGEAAVHRLDVDALGEYPSGLAPAREASGGPGLAPSLAPRA